MFRRWGGSTGFVFLLHASPRASGAFFCPRGRTRGTAAGKGAEAECGTRRGRWQLSEPERGETPERTEMLPLSARMCGEGEPARTGISPSRCTGLSGQYRGRGRGGFQGSAEAEAGPVAFSARGAGVRIGAGVPGASLPFGAASCGASFCPAKRCRNGRVLPPGLCLIMARASPPARRRRRTKKEGRPRKRDRPASHGFIRRKRGECALSVGRRRMIQRRLLALRYSTSRSGKSENMPSTLSFLKDTSSTSLKSLKPLGRESLRSVQECSFMPF